MMKRARIFTAVALVLTAGCTALIGVPDLESGPFADGGTTDSTTITTPKADSSVEPMTDGSVATTDAGDAAVPPVCTSTTDTTSDALNCGVCGHSCKGLSCSNSMCQPAELAPGLGHILMMTGDATYLYYSIYAPGSIGRVRKDGSMPAEVLVSDNVDFAVGVAIDGNTLYFGVNAGLFSCDISNGATTCLATRKKVAPNAQPSKVGTQYGLEDVALYQGNVYWGDDIGTVFRVPTDGGAQVALWTGIDGFPFKLAFGAGKIYASTYDDFTLLSAQIDGGNPQSAGDLSTSELYLPYITADDTAYDYAYVDYDTGDGMVVAGNHATHTTSLIAPNPTVAGQPMGVAIDAQYIYWMDVGTFTNDSSNRDGRLLRCLRAGCANGVATVLATEALGGGPVWLDDDFIYFAEANNDGPEKNTANGRIRRVTK